VCRRMGQALQAKFTPFLLNVLKESIPTNVAAVRTSIRSTVKSRELAYKDSLQIVPLSAGNITLFA